ncbi:MAG: hypothetical protein OEM02_08135 [Desulfobulbaceae bacterium]|nr:hypothetical protein [Desulfobulbaceae bacterium]
MIVENKIKWIVTAFLLLVPLSGQTKAASSPLRLENPTVKLEVEHIKKTITFNEKKNDLLPNRPAIINLRRSTAVRVVIKDNNPLLFTYQGVASPSTTVDYENALRLITQINTVLELGEGDSSIKSPSKEFDKVNGSSISISNEINCYDEDIKKNNQQSKDARPIEEQCNSVSDTFNDELLMRCVNRLGCYIKEQKMLINKPIEDQKKAVDKWKLGLLKTGIDAQLNNGIILLERHGKLRAVKKQVENGTNGGAPNIAKQDGNRVYHLASLISFKKNMSQIYNSVNGYVAAVKSAGQGSEIAVIELNDIRLQSELAITVGRNSSLDSYFTPATRAIQDANIGTLKIVFKRETFVRLMMSAGAVYSFVDDIEYKVQEDAAGNRTVGEKSDNYTAVSGAVMLNIIPERLFENNFEPFLQVGVSPDSDNLGVLLGLGFSIYPFSTQSGEVRRSMTVSGGVIMQQVESLEGGLYVGAPLVRHDDLKTKDGWESGFYIQFGVDINTL